MPNTETVVDNYIEMWNETDPQRRRELVARTVTEDARYLDPLMAGEGIDGISEMIAGAQAQFPCHRFKLVAGPDAHHDRVRFTWALAPDGGDPVAVGVDFATVADDGRLRAITGSSSRSGRRRTVRARGRATAGSAVPARAPSPRPAHSRRLQPSGS